MTEAVIFDFDGVIADTMQDNLKAWQAALAPYNIPVPAEEYFRLEGMGRHEIARHFIGNNKDSKISPEAVAADKEELYKRLNSFRVFDHVTDILDWLQEKQVRIGLVTGASRDRITHTLDARLGAYFTAIVTVDDVQLGKPHPEPYLKGMSMLQSDPAHTFVVENAILGVDAAIAAGCTCLALETTLSRSALGKANYIFKNHYELLNFFKETIS